MRVAIVGNGMAFRRDTIWKEGLGGSEQAQLCMAQALAMLPGYQVANFCRFPKDGAWGMQSDGVFWAPFDQFGSTYPTEFDVVIHCRNDRNWSDYVKTRANVLWIQDFATDEYPWFALDRFDEVWAVSHWQAHQWADTLTDRHLDYPPIWVTQNSIVRMPSPLPPVIDDRRRLLFASRPERGLWPLVRDGGIMERLPEYHLYVAGYNDRNPRFRDFYAQLDALIEKRPNVTNLGSLPAHKLRFEIKAAAAYVMPTPYRETSCILARECIEQLTPMIVTPAELSGALTETLGDATIIGSRAEFDSETFCADFAERVRTLLEGDPYGWGAKARRAMTARGDLYWEPVARSWATRMETLVERK